MVIQRLLLVVIFFSVSVFSQYNYEEDPIKFSAWGAFRVGRFGSAFNQEKYIQFNPDTDFSNKWYSNFMGGLLIYKTIEDVTNIRLHLGVMTYYRIYKALGANVEYQRRAFAASLNEVSINHTYELDPGHELLLEFGYIPLKYNPQAINLGEYLVRSMAYPTVIESGYGQAGALKVGGLHLRYSFPFGEKSKVKLDGYVTSEIRMHPLFDFSGIFFACTNIEDIVQIGGGVNFHNLISVNKKTTTPGLNDEFVNKTGVIYPIRDSITGTIDSVYYTTKATSLMARVTLSPLSLLGAGTEGSIFGVEDGKIFVEKAILGWKNYPGWFEDRNERSPIMFGFNIPAFKVLDVISFQLQYLNMRYWNTYENYLLNSSLVPYTGVRNVTYSYDQFCEADSIHRHDDDWKWSIHMTKTMNKRIKFDLQFANDNLFKTSYMPPPPAIARHTEVLGGTWMRERVQKIDANGTPMVDNDGLPIMTWGKDKWGFVKDWYWMGSITFYM